MILGILGGISGMLSGIFAVTVGGLGGAFGMKGASDVIGLGFAAVLLGIIGIIGGAIANRNIKWSRSLMLFSGVLGFIAISAFWIIAGLLLIIGGLLALRKENEQKQTQEVLNNGEYKIGITKWLGKSGVPGFRSGKTWKIALTVCGYVFIFMILLVLISPSQSPTTVQKSEPSQTIFIKQYYRTANTIAEYNKAPQGKTYLIVTLEIENKGYKKFNTNSFYWEAEVNKLRYSASSATFSLNDKLELVDVLDGGKVKGSIAFEVPEGTVSYTTYYNAPFTNYNIVWT